MNDSIDATLHRFRDDPGYHWFLWGLRHLATMPALAAVWIALVWSGFGEFVFGVDPPIMVYIWPIAGNLVVALAAAGVGTWDLRAYFRRRTTSVPFATVLRRALAMARKDFFVPGASTRG